jgi:selenium metabolism protein YedF
VKKMTELLTVDARGLACPQPVLETKRVLDEGIASHFRVLVDNDASQANVSRFARNQGCAVELRNEGPGHFEITIARNAGAAAPAAQEELIPCPVPEAAPAARSVVYIANYCMGRGDDELGAKLMRGFLRTWIDITPHPWRMIFLNSGVKLTTLDDEAVEALSLLAEHGVEVLSCGTCLKHFGLEEKLKVGKVTNMYEVIESLNAATKVLSPD